MESEVSLVLIISTAVRLGVALAGICAARYLLHYFDRAAGINFVTDVWAKIKEDPKAMAWYFGCRFIGVALMVGLAVR